MCSCRHHRRRRLHFKAHTATDSFGLLFYLILDIKFDTHKNISINIVTIYLIWKHLSESNASRQFIDRFFYHQIEMKIHHRVEVVKK